MQEFTDKIRAALSERSGLPAQDLKLEQPRDPKLGDFAFPCFPLAKALKKAPPAIAAELAGALAEDLDGISVEAAGPYLNFRFDLAKAATLVLPSWARGEAPTPEPKGEKAAPGKDEV